VLCPTRIVADADTWQAWEYVCPAAVAQRMTRAGEYVRAVVTQRHACAAAAGRPIARDAVSCRLGHPAAGLPFEILMRGDGPPARIRAPDSVELDQYRWEPSGREYSKREDVTTVRTECFPMNGTPSGRTVVEAAAVLQRRLYPERDAERFQMRPEREVVYLSRANRVRLKATTK
jgi:hypothetical protein